MADCTCASPSTRSPARAETKDYSSTEDEDVIHLTSSSSDNEGGDELYQANMQLQALALEVKANPKKHVGLAIPVGDYLVRPIGLGECSDGTSIYLGSHISTGVRVACKFITKNYGKSEDEIEMEHALMRMLDHPHIVKLFDVYDDFNTTCIIMEYAAGGDLLDYINKRKRVTESDARRLFLQLLDAVEYMHSQLVVHRDLKAENIFLSEDYNVLIGDFGYGAVFDPQSTLNRSCGTLYYAAPEIILGRDYVGPEVDVWSLGVLLFTMVAGSLPFWSTRGGVDQDKSVARKIVKLEYTFPPFMSDELKDLLASIFKYAHERPSISTIRQHSWLALAQSGQGVLTTAERPERMPVLSIAPVAEPAVIISAPPAENTDDESPGPSQLEDANQPAANRRRKRKLSQTAPAEFILRAVKDRTNVSTMESQTPPLEESREREEMHQVAVAGLLKRYKSVHFSLERMYSAADDASWAVSPS